MLPGYANLLQLAQQKSDAIFLDFACACNSRRFMFAFIP